MKVAAITLPFLALAGAVAVPAENAADIAEREAYPGGGKHHGGGWGNWKKNKDKQWNWNHGYEKGKEEKCSDMSEFSSSTLPSVRPLIASSHISCVQNRVPDQD